MSSGDQLINDVARFLHDGRHFAIERRPKDSFRFAFNAHEQPILVFTLS
jgi:hypothetical protein